MAKILYLGADSTGSTSLHRALALKRLGNEVIIKSPHTAVEDSLKPKIFGFIHYNSGYRFLQGRIRKWLNAVQEDNSGFDLIWVDSGELFGSKALKLLKKFGCPVILYNIDDPTGSRDGRRFDSLRNALNLYDLVVVVRKETAIDCKKFGAKNVKKVYRSYDEIAHQPFNNVEEIPEQYKSEVAFIGTWMRGEGRDKFMLALADSGIPISIWGGRWNKSPYWSDLKPYYRGEALSGRDYVAAMQGAKICIGLLSEGNRDLHTTRSLEVTFAGGLLCAERTSEHLELYKEGVEALFWDDVDECITKCKEMLTNDERREKIRLAGMKRVRELNVGNEDICQEILDEIAKL